MKKIFVVLFLIFLSISMARAYEYEEEDYDDDRYEYEREEDDDDDRYDRTSVSPSVETKTATTTTIITLDQSIQNQIDTAVNNFYTKLVSNNYSSNDINTVFSNVLDIVNTKISSENLSEKNLLVLTHLKTRLEDRIASINLDLNDLLVVASGVDFNSTIKSTDSVEKQISSFTSSGGRTFSIYQNGDRFYFVRPDGTRSNTDFPSVDETIKYLSLNTRPKVVTNTQVKSTVTNTPKTVKSATTTVVSKPAPITTPKTTATASPTSQASTPAKTTPVVTPPKVDTTTQAS